MTLIPIADALLEYAREVAAALKADGVRVDIDDRDERMQAKIREFEMNKTPYAMILGKREVAQGTVSVRSRENGDLGAMPVADFLARTAEARALGTALKL